MAANDKILPEDSQKSSKAYEQPAGLLSLPE